MAILHRAILTWFILLVFLILLCLRLESRTHWNWFIVFIPMWIYDGMLLIYVLFHMISHCKNAPERFRNVFNKKIWYITAIGLKMAAQIIICIKLEYAKVNLPIHVVMAPIWLLLPCIVVHVSIKLLNNNGGRY
ncbi:transmembrane protein 60 [Arctopsyche grandis]|uniref:transmembrane protein 60 n=1 Tax=Arctopsyche grandis TaxID=121162 RepID=UPI00406D9A64